MLGSVVQVHLSPPPKLRKRDLQPCRPSFCRRDTMHMIRLARSFEPAAPAQGTVKHMEKILVAILAAGLGLACATQALAERNFPDSARRGNLMAYTYPSMKIG